MARYMQKMMASMVTLTFLLSLLVIADIAGAQTDAPVFKGAIKSKSRQPGPEPFKGEIKSRHEGQVNEKTQEGSMSIKAGQPRSEPTERGPGNDVVRQPGAAPSSPLTPPG
jgi:hypothetical protein